MDYQISPTTAEKIVTAVEAVVVNGNGTKLEQIAQFLDVAERAALSAVDMACQIGFTSKSTDGTYDAAKPQATYIVSSNPLQRIALLRLWLESYEPFAFFKARLDVTENSDIAARQTRAKYALAADKEEIRDTLISLGQYTNAILSQGAGVFTTTVFESSDIGFADLARQIAAEKSDAETLVRRRVGNQAYDFIAKDEVGDPLLLSVRALQKQDDPKTPILHASNSVESFMVQLAGSMGHTLAGNGIVSKAEELKKLGLISKKHLGMLNYLGHVRNAADHGTDPETGSTWDITIDTADDYFRIAVSTIRSIVSYQKKEYVL